MTDKTTVAVLIDGEQIQDWVARALEILNTEETVTITLVILNTRDSPSTKEKLRTLAERGAWGGYTLVRWGYRQIIDNQQSFRNTRSIENIEAFENARRISCTPIEDGIWNELPEDIVNELEKVDVVLRFGFGLLKGDALQAPKHGVLSFHHGDLREYRGPPAGFWEYLHEKDTAGVTLQRLNESIDEGEIVVFEPVDISDAKTWSEVQRRLFETSVTMLPDGIKRVSDDDLMIPSKSGAYHGYPKCGDIVKYLFKSAKSIVERQI